jgi:P2 family phage major capsid protein
MHVMQPQTETQLAGYLQAVGKQNGTADTTRAFSVTPTVSQQLEVHTQESSEFLSRINIVQVDAQSGEKLGLGIGAGSPIASRTNTKDTPREPIDPMTMDVIGYQCRQTNFDTLLTYSQLDQWAKFPNFQRQLRDAILQQIGRDRIKIGWNGTSAAATTNRTANPLLQDVNIGWITKLRQAEPARVINEAVAHANKIRLGMTGDYASIDSLVYDVFNNIIDPWHRTSSLDFVAIMGRDLNADSRFPILNSTNPPSELIAADIIRTAGRVGSIPIVHLPYFPEKSLFITPLSNLSIYWQAGTRRRRIVDNPARDRIEDYQSVNEAYVIEDYGQCAFIENIEFVS